MSVIIPGSYDTPTLGHLDVIRRVAEEEDEVYAVVFNNPEKEYMFSPEDRARMLMLATEELENVLVSYSDGFVIDYMRDHGIDGIVKGYRNDSDLEWERVQADYNLRMGGFETRLLPCDPTLSAVSSTAAREAIREGRDLSELLPRSVAEYIKDLLNI